MNRLPLSLALTLCGVAAAQNNGISFTNGGADEHVDVAWAQGLVPTRGITVEAWITFDDNTVPIGQGNRWPTIARQDVTAGQQSWFLRVGWSSTGNRNLEWVVDTGAGLRFCVYRFAPNEFVNRTHVSCTFDGQTSVIHVNGVVAATLAAVGRIPDRGGILRIGNGDTSTPGAEVWNGTIDELRIWPFARTAAEITSSMGQELLLIPGGISFNFNGGFIDSSRMLVGVPTANVPFVMTAALSVAAAGGFAFGAASTTCAGDRLGASVGAASRHGNAAFSLICYDAPANANGAVFFSFARQTPPLSFLGILLHLDPAQLLPIGISVGSLGNGASRMALPLANNPTTVGVQFHSQFVFLAGTCGPFAIVGSEGLSVTIQ
jgi:hypothetical protein